jgi:hydrogenase nickel incorporation protein HypA/HybF
MHEISIASALVDAAIKAAEEHRASKVSKVHVTIGKLTALNPVQLEFIFNTITRNTILEGSKLLITLRDPVIECRECGFKGEVDLVESFHFKAPEIRCPECNTAEVDILQGGECVLTKLSLKLS